MEYCENGDLSKIIKNRKGKRFSQDEVSSNKLTYAVINIDTYNVYLMCILDIDLKLNTDYNGYAECILCLKTRFSCPGDCKDCVFLHSLPYVIELGKTTWNK